MKKLYLFQLIFISLFINTDINACLPGGITFTSQQEIDDFNTNYPGCTLIEGDVRIEEATFGDITNLNGLSNVTEIDGQFWIIKNQELIDLTGLNSLVKVGGYFWIWQNGSLTNVTGLGNLTTVDGDFRFTDNDELVSLSGLNNITSISRFWIDKNDVLTDISNLSSLTSLEGIVVSENNSIVTLTGLENVTSLSSNLFINDNLLLENVTGLDNLATIDGYIYFFNNESLESLSALSNLTSLGDYLWIFKNQSLTNFSGFENITSIPGYLSIMDNDNLSDISQLSGLTSLGKHLRILNNPMLTDLSGLENVLSIDGYLQISNNISLTNISGIANIDAATITSSSPLHKDLEIYDNLSLSECAVTSVCGVLDYVDKTKLIHDNLDGCNTEDEVYIDCQEPPSCSSLVQPVNGETNVNITEDLSWEPISGAEGYILTVGTTSGGTDIVDNEDLGLVTTYDPGDFPCGSEIFVNITPYNIGGNSIDCDEESFMTEFVVADAGIDVEICDNEDVQLQASGGTTYSWSPTSGLDNPDVADPYASPFNTTTYTVMVSNEGRCPDSDEIIVTVNESPVPNASATDESYFEANDGSATCDPSSAVAGFTYIWSNGETTQTISDLSPGNYTVTVTSSNNCSEEETVNVNKFICPILSTVSSIKDTVCFGSCDAYISIDSVLNGIKPFSYNWSNGSIDSLITDLCAGVYFVTVTDSKNCTVVDSFKVETNTAIIVNASGTDESANGAKDGTATCSPTGGVSPYSFLWSNGKTSQTIDSLAPGNYYVTVSDDFNCAEIDTVVITSFGCPILTINSIINDTLCYGVCDGFITINSVTNGVEPYFYEWSNGDSVASISNLCAGSYLVTITDSSSCSISESYTILELSEIIANASATDETSVGANDGSVNCSPSGGAIPYSFIWNTGSTTQFVDSLSPGEYIVTVTDNAGCTGTDTVNVNAATSSLVMNVQQNDVSCFGEADGSISILSVQNGVEPYTYLWADGSTDATRSNLSTGIYSVKVVDSNDKSISDTFNITQPDEIIINDISKVNLSNESLGSIKLTIDNENQFTYLWNGPDNFVSTDKDLIDLKKKGCYVLVVEHINTHCQIDTTVCISGSTSIIDLDLNNVRIYPNPIVDYIEIDFPENNNFVSKIQMFSITGHKIKEVIKNRLKNKLNIETKSISEGVYFLRISQNDKVIVRKIIVSK